MSDRSPARPFPRGALVGAAVLVGFALVSATAARLGGIGTTQVPSAAPAEVRDLVFEDGSDGAVVVYEAGSHSIVDVLAPGTNGFLFAGPWNISQLKPSGMGCGPGGGACWTDPPPPGGHIWQ